MKDETRVIFFKQDDESILAFFPELNYNIRLYGYDVKMSYQHIGQHGACDKDYLFECERAKPEEYQELKEELESIGYNLHVID